MDIQNGNYAEAIEKLTAPTASPADQSPHGTLEAPVLSAEHGLGPLHGLASRLHPPAEQTKLVKAQTPRSRWQRALASIGVFLLGQILGMLYVGLMKPGHADKLFAVITALTWAGPLIAWFALRRRNHGQRQIQGYPLHTLAEMSAGMAEPWIEVRIPEENMLAFNEAQDTRDKPPSPLELVAEEDLIVSFSGVYVRAKASVQPQTSTSPIPSQANRAIDFLHRAIVSELQLSPDQAWELESLCSEDIDDDIGGHVDHVAFVIKRGQHIDTDLLCEGLVKAVNNLRTQFDLMQND